jgi:CheY-like chemotaxis protein
MPKMNGFQLAPKIRSLANAKQNTPIIAMTANADFIAIKRSEDASINEIMPKRFTKSDLRSCIEKWLH